jgi:hypothetical protein
MSAAQLGDLQGGDNTWYGTDECNPTLVSLYDDNFMTSGIFIIPGRQEKLSAFYPKMYVDVGTGVCK